MSFNGDRTFLNLLGMKAVRSLFVFLVLAACVDRVQIDISQGLVFPIVIDGRITNEPGPYTISISKAFDIDSKYNLKAPVSVRTVTLSDNAGASEDLKEVQKGQYQTASNGMRGQEGHVYKLRIELLDGGVYESSPDTLNASGKIDALYHSFKSDVSAGKEKYGFDILFDASSGDHKSGRFLWKFIGTFQSDTNPELACEDPGLSTCAPCGEKACDECNYCNYKPICSGIRNISQYIQLNRANFLQYSPCECCTCWYNFFNSTPILSQDQSLNDGNYIGVKANYIPLDPWVFQHKVHVELVQESLSLQALNFYKAIKSQKEAVNSLFQPVTGKIPSNFILIKPTQTPLSGIFVATGVVRKTLFITRGDVHPETLIPSNALPWVDSCLKLFPNGTTTKPAFWE